MSFYFKSDPAVNCGLWVIMVCPHRFISCNSRSTLVGAVDGGRVCVSEGLDHGDFHILSIQVHPAVKTALKNSMLKKTVSSGCHL